MVEVGTLAVPVPESLDPRHATMARMAMVALPAIRLANIELGDWVVIQEQVQ